MVLKLLCTWVFVCVYPDMYATHTGHVENNILLFKINHINSNVIHFIPVINQRQMVFILACGRRIGITECGKLPSSLAFYLPET